MEHLAFILLNLEEAFPGRWDGSILKHSLLLRCAAIHPAFPGRLLETVLQISVPHYIYPIDRLQQREKMWDEYLLGIVLECPTASWLQHVKNDSTIQDLGTNIGGMLHRWGILCYAVQHVRFWSLRSWPMSDMNAGNGWFSCSEKLSRLPWLVKQTMYSPENSV